MTGVRGGSEHHEGEQEHDEFVEPDKHVVDRQRAENQTKFMRPPSSNDRARTCAKHIRTTKSSSRDQFVPQVLVEFLDV